MRRELVGRVQQVPGDARSGLSPGAILSGESDAEYRVLHSLGYGGNGETYLVSASTGYFRGSIFAAKVLYRDDETRVAFFQQEIKSLQTFSHPSIMRFYDEGVYAGPTGRSQPFFIAEYFPKNLSQINRLRTSAALKICYITQILSALDYLEAAEATHRDIKPANVFIKGELAALGDLGLLRIGLVSASDEESAARVEPVDRGAFPKRYRSPEMMRYASGGDPPGPKSDVYQLGLVAAWLFTGELLIPYTRSKFAKSPRKNLGTVEGERLAPEVASLIEQMLLHDEDDRPRASALLTPWQALLYNAAEYNFAADGFGFTVPG